jgi:pimeloyl-ACP methyl ester carboxylesterase
MKFKVSGSGAPLVLVHGALTDHRMWHVIEPMLAAKYQVFSVTQRFFFGGEPRDDRSFGYETHARDLVEFLQEEVKVPAHIVAWSYGADVCLLAAKFCPEAFRTAFLYEPGRHTHLHGDLLDAYFSDASIMFGGIGRTISEQGEAAATEQLVDASACRDGFFKNLTALDRTIQLDNAPTLPLQLQQGPSMDVSCADMGAIAFPICFSRGALTRELFRISTDAAYQCSSNGTLVIVDGATHMLPIEAPERFVHEVTTFINKADGS